MEQITLQKIDNYFKRCDQYIIMDMKFENSAPLKMYYRNQQLKMHDQHLHKQDLWAEKRAEQVFPAFTFNNSLKIV